MMDDVLQQLVGWFTCTPIQQPHPTAAWQGACIGECVGGAGVGSASCPQVDHEEKVEAANPQLPSARRPWFTSAIRWVCS